jgi:hypothetical protein
MNKPTAQIVASQYLRGLSDGSNPNGGREASGSLACYYLQGFADARAPKRGLSERSFDQLATHDKDGKASYVDGATEDGQLFVAELRKSIESAPEELDARALYNRVSNVAGGLIGAI